MHRSEEELRKLRVGTADLLEILMEAEPTVDFAFALGGDTFMDLTNWKWRRSREVLSFLQGRFIVLFRKGLSSSEALQERIDQLNKQEDGQARLLQIPTLQEVSSTQIRASNDVEELKELLHPEVLKYMKEHKLYAFATSQEED